jgi:hypothetical protein
MQSWPPSSQFTYAQHTSKLHCLFLQLHRSQCLLATDFCCHYLVLKCNSR